MWAWDYCCKSPHLNAMPARAVSYAGMAQHALTRISSNGYRGGFKWILILLPILPFQINYRLKMSLFSL